VVDESVALWLAYGVAVAQLVGVGAFVGMASPGARTWAYAIGTGIVGAVVGVAKLVLSH